MLVKLSTNKTVSAAATALQAAVTANHFGVIHVHNRQETTVKRARRSPESLNASL